MNVSMPAVSTSNTNTVKANAIEAMEESGESKGFFETLSSVIAGDEVSTEEGELVSDKEGEKDGVSSKGSELATGEPVDEQSEGEHAEPVKISAGDETADALLEGRDEEADRLSAEQAKHALEAKKSAANVAVDKSQTDTDEAVSDASSTVGAARGKQVEQTMDEGQALLGRLEQANKALQSDASKLTQAAVNPDAKLSDEAITNSENKIPVLNEDESSPHGAKLSVIEGEPDDTQSYVQTQTPISALSETNKSIKQAISESETALDLSQTGRKADLKKEMSDESGNDLPLTNIASLTTPQQAISALIQKDQESLTHAQVQGVKDNITPQSLVVSEQEQIEAKSIDQDVNQLGASQIRWDKEQQRTEAQQAPSSTGDGQSRVEMMLTDQQKFQLSQLNPSERQAVLAALEHALPTNTTQTAVASAVSQQLAPTEMKATSVRVDYSPMTPQQMIASELPATPQTSSLTELKPAPTMPELMSSAAALNPAAVAAGSVPSKAMQAALGNMGVALKGASSSKGEKPEPSSLAGQIQGALSQQSITSTQQSRLEGAQQANAPLQLTREMVNEQVQEKVQMMMSKNLKNLDIRLDPPELGRMQIRMNANNDLANIHFTVTNPQAREIIEQTLPRLREMLAQQGVQLAESSVQHQSAGQQQKGYTSTDGQESLSSGEGSVEQSDENTDMGENLDLNVTSNRDGISFYA